MGYRLSKQKSLGYSPYFMLFGREPIFQARIQDEEERVFDETQGVEAMKVFLGGARSFTKFYHWHPGTWRLPSRGMWRDTS